MFEREMKPMLKEMGNERSSQHTNHRRYFILKAKKKRRKNFLHR